MVQATILADATVAIICDPARPRGQMLIDDTYLLSRGLRQQDLACYRYDPDHEPPRFLAETEGGYINRGDVREVQQDQQSDDYERMARTSRSKL